MLKTSSTQMKGASLPIYCVRFDKVPFRLDKSKSLSCQYFEEFV